MPLWAGQESRLPLHELFHGQELVYLTPDADEELAFLDKDKVYVIGGLADKGRISGTLFDTPVTPPSCRSGVRLTNPRSVPSLLGSENPKPYKLQTGASRARATEPRLNRVCPISYQG